MSEQKYYVRFSDEVVIDSHGDSEYLTLWLNYEEEFDTYERDCTFTKSELAKIMDGALYIEPFLGETGIHPEWINPLIELVPAEEG